MQRPSVKGLAETDRRAARGIAERLAGAGHRGWIVGGTVRDLALGRVPKDIDMVSAATPDDVERLFERTIPVGRAFGIVRVVSSGVEIELATFRSESGYEDARRPGVVTYGSSVEEDATRRDFTCNAMFLDPLADELRDPYGGLADLGSGILRTVGEAAERFREDGLRLLRMARFEAAHDLSPAPGLHGAAAGAADALRGVSAERVLDELGGILAGPDPRRAFAVLAECGLLERVLPAGWAERAHGGRSPAEALGARLGALAALGPAPGPALGLAILLEFGPWDEPSDGTLASGLDVAKRLRVSRELLAELRSTWTLRRTVDALAAAADPPASVEKRAMRDPAWEGALRLARAWAVALGRPPEPLDRLESRRAAYTPADLRPAPWIVSSDIEAAGVPRGPDWSTLLGEAEDGQLDGRLASRDDALAWLAARAAELDQEGGKTRRKP